MADDDSLAYRFDRLYRLVWRPELLPSPFLWLLTRSLFAPSLIYNLLYYALQRRRKWYDRIDETVILGALPMWWHFDQLSALGVRRVVNMIDEFGGHLTQMGEIERRKWRELYLPTPDYVQPTLDDLTRAVDFIDEAASRQESVYVHCKAGKGRAPTVVVAYLMRKHNMSPRQAQDYIVARRPQISKNLYLRENVIEFHRRLLERNVNTEMN